MLSILESVLSASEHELGLHRYKVPLVLTAYDSRGKDGKRECRAWKSKCSDISGIVLTPEVESLCCPHAEVIKHSPPTMALVISG